MIIALFVHTRPPTYEAHGTVTLLVPANQRAPNIFSAFSSSLIQTAGLLADNASSGATRAEMNRAGLGGYTAMLTNTGDQWQAVYDTPTVDIVARDRDPDRAQRTFEAVAAFVSATLDRWQDESGVGEHSRITSAVTGATATAVPLLVNTKRAYAALLAGFLMAETMAARYARRRRPAGRAGAGPVRAAGGPPAPGGGSAARVADARADLGRPAGRESGLAALGDI
ncbi:hypothetical protein I6A84_28950 [Frankia sp. CNm7]|uniref:Uncharacterized protein n=1 Tax=Frankia nepalensis TaxID=1836974 RepID=A0A937R625_9ACTN|nr:hypothetical protein [Frankia nepalensis]MBL7501231.1 hypothetical protein [Frankia nepalensis]MBL7512780.1 hypothetical protein [Frankia nepalensis]MBL7521999.1 hypothetical protein [Frankia nepalensis]MBL7626403.1 hypothetical protein [Frankia nepalensis]